MRIAGVLKLCDNQMPMIMEQMVKRHILSNGLNILLIPSKRSPVVALQGWVKYGAADETDDIAGVAHLFEHLLFKGTENRAVGQIAQEIEGLGGDLNAYTTYDHTVMHMTLASRHCRQGLEILSDALLNSVVDEEELENERPVILEEIKRRNDMPASHAGDLFREMLFAGHPYSRPVIGYDHVVAGISRERIVEEYHNHYTTDRLFIVVCGDFKESAVIKTCEELFKNTPTKKMPRNRPSPGAIPQQRGQFKNVVIPDPIIHMGWRVPGNIGADVAALDALALIVGQGESSRLYRRLVNDEKLVRSIGSSVWSPRDEGTFSIGIKGDSKLPENMKRIEECIQQCLSAEISEKELSKAKKNLLADSIYARESVDGIADRYAYCESIADDWKADHFYLEAIQELTLEDLSRVRSEYLHWDKSVCAGAIPEKMKAPRFSGKELTNPVKAKKRHKFQEKEHGVWERNFQGLKVLVRPSHELPVFSMRWVGWGGQRLENKKLQGVGSLWARTVCDGATKKDGYVLSREEINNQIDSASASLSSFHGRNSFGFQLDGLSEDLDSLVETLSAVYRAPTFEEDIFKQAKRHQQQDQRTQKQNPGALMGKAFNELMFPNHAYGRSSLGTPDSLRAIKSKDVLSYHRKLIKQPQVLCVTGDVHLDALDVLLEEHFSFLKLPAQTELKKAKKVAPKKGFSKVQKSLKKEQSHILWGFPTCTMNSKDRWPLLALSSVLSGQGGRLFMELRDKQSLCYTVAPTHIEGVDAGYFAFYMGTSPEKVSTALAGMENEILKVIDHGIPETEWKQACRYVVGNHEIAQQSLGSQSMGMALDELYGHGYEEYFQFAEHLEKVKATDIQKVAKKYLDPRKASSQILAVVGPKL